MQLSVQLREILVEVTHKGQVIHSFIYYVPGHETAPTMTVQTREIY